MATAENMQEETDPNASIKSHTTAKSHASAKSHITHSQSSNASRISMKLKQCAQAKEIELAARLKIIQEQDLLEERKRELQNKLNEDDAKAEEDEGLRKAQEIIRHSQERAARIRRQQEIVNEQRELTKRQEQLKLQGEYNAAKQISSLYQQLNEDNEVEGHSSMVSGEVDSKESVRRWLHRYHTPVTSDENQENISHDMTGQQALQPSNKVGLHAPMPILESTKTMYPASSQADMGGARRKTYADGIECQQSFLPSIKEASAPSQAVTTVPVSSQTHEYGATRERVPPNVENKQTTQPNRFTEKILVPGPSAKFQDSAEVCPAPDQIGAARESRPRQQTIQQERPTERVRVPGPSQFQVGTNIGPAPHHTGTYGVADETNFSSSANQSPWQPGGDIGYQPWHQNYPVQQPTYQYYSRQQAPTPKLVEQHFQQHSPTPHHNDNFLTRSPVATVNFPSSRLDVDESQMMQDSERDYKDTIAEVVKRQGDLTELLIEQSSTRKLPSHTITPFSGDPLEYASFMQAFEFSVERNTSSDRERLYHLEKVTEGEPKGLVKSCQLLKPEEGYKKAKALLKKDFGNKYKIAEAVMKRANEWREIRSEDPDALKRFSLFLKETEVMMMGLNFMNELEHNSTIRMLSGKLPYHLRRKWRSVTDEVLEEKDRMVAFTDLVRFVEKETRILNNPAFGMLKDKPQKHHGKPSMFKKNSFATNTSSTSTQQLKKTCGHCESDDHELECCSKLMEKNVSERLQCLRNLRVCFGCLKKATHMSKECKKKLTCKKCKKSHPTVLHIQNKDKQHASTTNQSNKDTSKSSMTCGLTGAGAKTEQSSPLLVPVLVQSRKTGITIETIAFLDDGSDAVFCTNKLQRQLGVKGKKTSIEIQTITGSEVVESKVLDGLVVMDTEGRNVIPLPRVYTQRTIPASIKDLVTHEQVKNWPYLKEVKLPDLDVIPDHIGILIGNNVPKAHEPWEIINSKGDGPYATRTLLGWTVHGVRKNGGTTTAVNRISIQSIDTQLVKLYNHDFPESLADDMPEKSIKDKHFLANVEETVKLTDHGHYEIGLPLEDKEVIFPNNKPQAEVRVAHLKRKLTKNETFYTDYKTTINQMINKGYAEKVPAQELEGQTGRTWYIPHHGVVHPRKNKLRVVYDCAATYKGFSLNKELLQGPDLTSNLHGVVMRFRKEPVALMGDIEAMFHQVEVSRKDRDLLRFLWWNEGDIERPVEEYRMCVHPFGASSSPAIANFALRRTAEAASSQYSQEVIDTVLHNFYVDDCLWSVPTEAEAISLIKNLQEVCRSGGFRLTKWLSNSREVLKTVPPAERAKDIRSLDLSQDPLPPDRALGMKWKVESDTFGYSIDLQEKPPTRRGILSTVSSVYDPLGLIAPVILPAKHILQSLCQQKLGWDQPIPCDYLIRWQKWLQEIPKMTEFEVDRCLKPPHTVKAQWHHFCDASEVGYGTATYLRTVTEDDKVHCSLVMSKSRVAPLKQISIPRLELTSATVAVKVNQMIHRELDIGVPTETFFWTDSMTVLRYINNSSSRFHTFVANRIAVIQDGSEPSQWRYVNTASNPADECSRGLSVENFLRNTRWTQGPDFLYGPESEWLKNVDSTSDTDMELTDDPEVKKKLKVATVHAEESTDTLNKLIEHYSSWYRLRLAIAWILRVRKRLYQKVIDKRKRKLLENPRQEHHQEDEDTTNAGVSTKEDKEPDFITTSRPTLTELQAAEKAVVKYIQQRAFHEEIKAICQLPGDQTVQKDRSVRPVNSVKKTSPLSKLNPVMVDGVLRVGGRLSRSALPEETKFPVILPKKSYVTQLILEEIHRTTGHSGRSHMLACLYKKYWVIAANSAARKIVHKCVTCRKYKAKTGAQMMADLPAGRLIPDDPPFTRVGLDYFGPFEVKRGRCLVKRYGVVFTCLSTRAIHLEKADSLDTDSCINAIRRFVSRRGQAKELLSDNGTNFVGAARELRAEMRKWNEAKIQDYLQQTGINWKFNPPAASHFGGIWERQIRTVRKILVSIMQQQPLTDESLSTFFCEVEAIINSRPITTVSGDPGDLEPLTPNHLLLLKGKPMLPPILASETGPYARKRWKQVQYLTDIFWKRWSQEYLCLLQKRQKWVRPTANFKVGDIVIIIDNSRPRNSWQLGRVITAMPGKDGLVRQVQVKTASSTLVRPISKLCLLVEADK